MSKDFDENIKEEVIILSDLKYSGTMILKKEEEYPKKSKIETEGKEEKNNNTFILKNYMKYYQIDNEKTKELEKVFKQIKLKINFNSQPRILREGKFYTISKGVFTIYDERFFKILLEIKFEENYKIFSAIQLDNKDLVFLAENQLIIYRLQNEKYFLFQKIDENRAGFKLQNAYSGCIGYQKPYVALFIKEISGNRFICVSNYGFKIYSLNDKNKYSIDLLEKYYESIRAIYELDKDNFIFCTQIDFSSSSGGPEHNTLIIDKINLKAITNEEKENKLKNLGDKMENKKDVKRIIELLKYTYCHNEFLKYGIYDELHYFKGNTILKNKFFITGIDKNILIFDILTGKLLKKYKVLGTSFKSGCNIKKWNNNEDNEFIINSNGKIILFELTNDKELKIINQVYFQDIKSLKHLNEKNNQFYDDNSKEDSFCNSNIRSFDYNYKRNDNKNVSVSIFY